MQFFLQTRSFHDAVRKVEGAANVEFIMHMVEIVFPQRTDEVLGAEVRDRYLQVVKRAKSQSRDADNVCDTAIPMIQHEMMLALEKESTQVQGGKPFPPMGLLGTG
jgi:hypothetical protein